MWKINDYKAINTELKDTTTSEQTPEVILDTTNNTWWKVFELTHFGWFKNVIWTILWKKINASLEIERLTQFRQADDYNE